MNLLFLDHAPFLGGAEVSLLELLRTLDRRRFTPTLACPPGPLADRAHALDVSVAKLSLEKLQSLNPLASLLRLRRGSRALRQLVAALRPDLVHANTLRAAAYAATVAPALGIPFVWHVRDAAVPAWTRRRLLHRCSAAVAISQFVARPLGGGPKVHLIPNGLDITTVPPPAASLAFRAELGIPPDAPVIGTLGRLLPWKGQHRFLAAAARLAPQLPAARFLVVGSPLSGERRDYLGELRQQADRLGIADRLVFPGFRDDPLAALGAMDVVVNCSLGEPFGRVLIEAMACSRPVVAFDSGAVPEIVQHGVTGLLVPAGDIPALADAVLALARDPSRCQAMGEAGRRRVAAQFPLDASTRALESLFASLAPTA